MTVFIASAVLYEKKKAQDKINAYQIFLVSFFANVNVHELTISPEFYKY